MKGKESVVESMGVFLKEGGVKEEIKEILKLAVGVRSKRVLFDLIEMRELENRLNNKAGILPLYYRMRSLKEVSFNNYDVHRILTEFFVAQKGKIELFTIENIRKLGDLLLMDLPQKLSKLIVDVD